MYNRAPIWIVQTFKTYLKSNCLKFTIETPKVRHHVDMHGDFSDLKAGKTYGMG